MPWEKVTIRDDSTDILWFDRVRALLPRQDRPIPGPRPLRTTGMRALGLLLATVLTVTVAGCGSDESDSPKTATDQSTATTPSTPDSMAGMDMGDMGSDSSEDGEDGGDAAASTQADAEKIAVRLEQVFAGSTYPKDLAGALEAAQQEGLETSAGNTIAGYEYDADDVEFKLCVENSSGAYAIYDTRPMSMRGAGDSGGCP